MALTDWESIDFEDPGDAEADAYAIRTFLADGHSLLLAQVRGGTRGKRGHQR